jgi:hypothetical protein
MGCAGLACAQNLIVNGDFEAGNVGFSTDYIYSPGDIWLIETYDVLYDVSDAHPLAELHHDHTTGAGLMMAANGALPNLPIVWSETVTVTPAMRYEFSAWVANWAHGSSGHMAPLEFRINGTPVAFWETPVVGQWFPVSARWDSGAATTAVITIIDLSVEWDGNDPALDDLWLDLLGDMNCDGLVNFDDINPFVLALSDPTGYQQQYPTCNILNGDCNSDGAVDFDDINPFVALLGAGYGNGACCYPDDSCAVTTLANCTGTWLGVNTTCDPNPCPATGACCYANGSCAVTTPASCTGTWQGVNTTCDPNPCEPPTGACCYADGSCHFTSQTACTAHGGTYRGDGTVCEPNPCPGYNWIQLSPPDAPAPRLDFGLAYDRARAVLVVFGGRDGGHGHYGDTWEWDGANWTKKSDSGPCPRAPSHLAYDQARGMTVLFGGADSDHVYGDTWEWDGTNWTWRSEEGPVPRDRHGLAYDSARGVTVLFGGWAEDWNVTYSDTWEWNGISWTQRSVSGPFPRFEFGMVYDSARARTVLFGGATYYGLDGETWEWDGTNWTRRSDNGPPARRGPAMAYDTSRDVSVLFGGITVNGWLRDTWEWDGAHWTHKSDGGPSSRWASDMEYDNLRGVTTLFGGWSGSHPVNDTWQLTWGECYS